MTDDEIQKRLERDDEFWTGPRFVGLLFATLGVALGFIYFISSVRTGDYTWHPLAHHLVEEVEISGW
mgnify:CR=1 FL=1